MTSEGMAKEICELRRSLGLSQEKLAPRLGVSFSTVNRWEKDRGKPSPLALQRIDELREEVRSVQGERKRAETPNPEE
jgi:DNA-binding transcriptional regulator YiaG